MAAPEARTARLLLQPAQVIPPKAEGFACSLARGPACCFRNLVMARDQCTPLAKPCGFFPHCSIYPIYLILVGRSKNNFYNC